MASDSRPVTDVAPASARETKYDIPGISSEDLKLLSKELNFDSRYYEPCSSFVSPGRLTEPAAKKLDALSQAVILDSIKHRLTGQMAEPEKQSEVYDRASYLRESFSMMRLESIRSQLRFSADDGNLQVYIPSQYFPGISQDERKSALEEVARQMTKNNLWRITRTVAEGKTTLHPEAAFIAQSVTFALRDVLDSHYKLKDVESWTDGPPEGSEPNKLQLEVFEARKLLPDTLERNVHIPAIPLTHNPWDGTTGPRRPKNLLLTVGLPLMTKDTVEALREENLEELKPEMNRWTSWRSALTQANQTIPKESRTYVLTSLQRDPGDRLITGFNLASEGGEGHAGDLFPAFSDYYSPVKPKGLMQQSGVYTTMDSKKMCTAVQLSSKGTRRPLVYPQTVQLIVYESGGHRGWTGPLMRSARRRVEGWQQSLETKETREIQVDAPAQVDANDTHPDDNSDHSFTDDVYSYAAADSLTKDPTTMGDLASS